MIEDNIYDRLNAYVGIPVVPLSPGATDHFDTEQVTQPAVYYLRHATQPHNDLDGNLQYEEIDFEIIILGNNFQEASYYSELVKTLINGSRSISIISVSQIN